MNLGRLSVFVGISLWAGTAVAQPPDDPGHTLTIQIENDSSRRTSDMYYTSGERLAYTSPTGALPGPLSDLGHTVLGDGQQRFAFELSQYIFTPFNTSAQNPPYTDRPYAGILMGTAVADPGHRHHPHRACPRPGSDWPLPPWPAGMCRMVFTT